MLNNAHQSVIYLCKNVQLIREQRRKQYLERATTNFFFYTQTQLLTDSNVFFLKILFILFDLFDDIDIIIVLYCVNHLNR